MKDRITIILERALLKALDATHAADRAEALDRQTLATRAFDRET